MKTVNVVAAICLAAVSCYGAAAEPRSAAAHRAANRMNAAGNPSSAGSQDTTRMSAPAAGQTGVPQEERTWTNDRLGQLRGHGGISEFNQLPEARAEVAREVASEETASTGAYERLQDARWYAERAAALRSEIQALELELARYQTELQLVRAQRTMEAGLAYYQDTIGITPEAGIELRTALLRELRSQLDGLADLARRNNMLPGVVRQ